VPSCRLPGGSSKTDAAESIRAFRPADLVVVPRDHWHRHVDAVELVEIFHTPGESLPTDDPALESPASSRRSTDQLVSCP
jgi:hypothetical protein